MHLAGERQVGGPSFGIIKAGELLAPPHFMAKLRLGVFQIQDEWRLCQLGRFKRAVDAISAGGSAADQATRSAFEVELHIMTWDGELRLADLACLSKRRPTSALSRRRTKAAAEAFIEGGLLLEPAAGTRAARSATRYVKVGNA